MIYFHPIHTSLEVPILQHLLFHSLDDAVYPNVALICLTIYEGWLDTVVFGGSMLDAGY